jgi:hypothetical protein
LLAYFRQKLIGFLEYSKIAKAKAKASGLKPILAADTTMMEFVDEVMVELEVNRPIDKS